MAQTSPPGPADCPDDGRADRGRLSPWEQRILDRIEGDLTAGDPAFARRMTRRARPGTGPFVVALRWLARLVVALVVLVVAVALLPASGWAVIGLISTLVLGPCLLLWATETGHED